MAGEEITYDYKFDSFDDGQQCLCGTERCRGSIRGPTWRFHLQLGSRLPTKTLSVRDRDFIRRRHLFLTRNHSRLLKMQGRSRRSGKSPAINTQQVIAEASNRTSGNSPANGTSPARVISILTTICDELISACKTDNVHVSSKKLRHIHEVKKKVGKLPAATNGCRQWRGISQRRRNSSNR